MRRVLALVVLLGATVATPGGHARECRFEPDLLYTYRAVHGVSAVGCGDRVLARPVRDAILVTSPTWLPNGRSFVYAWTEQPAPVFLTLSHVVRVDLPSLRQQELATLPGLVTASVDAAPDGKTLAITASPGNPLCLCPRLFLVGSDGLGLRPVAAAAPAMADAYPSFAPDSGALAFLRAEPDPHLGLEWQGAFVTRADQQTSTALTRRDEIASHVEWSPDGGRIALIVSRVGPLLAFGEGDLVVVRPDGTGRRTLLSDPISHQTASQWPSWSPDGRYVAVTRHRRVTVVDVRTGRARVVPGGFDQRPSWSPDGRTIAFARATHGWTTPRLWTVDTRTWRARYIGPFGGLGALVWRPRHAALPPATHLR